MFPDWYADSLKLKAERAQAGAHTAEMRFPDGELDLWHLARQTLPGAAIIDTPTKKYCEANRDELIGRIGMFAEREGLKFAVREPEAVRLVQGAFHDIWSYELENRIVRIPRYVLESRPQNGERMTLRSIVPAFLIIGSMAHETAHGVRHVRYPALYAALFEGHRHYNRHELDLSRTRQEELATDVEAYGILSSLKVPMSPYDYADTIPLNTGTHQDFLDATRPV
jgi:hypothetical protein